MLENDIEGVFNKYPNILYGYTNLDNSEYVKEYKSALVFAVPYDKHFTLDNYSEIELEDAIIRARNVVNELVDELVVTLNNNNVKYKIAQVAQNDEESLLAPFSFKYAALNAGIGWIGKNNVIVTEQYGSQQRLGAILIDHVARNYGVRKLNQCPKECNRCVEICPFHAIKGVEWYPDVKRQEMIDYKLCNKQRSKFIEKHNRKSACGLCIIVCPLK